MGIVGHAFRQRHARQGLALVGIAVAFAIGAMAACGGSGKGACDPTTIEANGNCYWEKTRACDAIGCIPPDECVEVSGSPSHVECRKSSDQKSSEQPPAQQ